MLRLIVLLCAVLFTYAAERAEAQAPLTPRGLGLAGASIGVARGHEAIFANPANLGLPDSPGWSVAALQVTTGGVLDGLSFSDLSSLVRFGDLSDSERDRLFEDVPAGGLDVDYDVRVALGSLQYGHAALGISYNTVGGHALSRDLIELFLYGYEEGRTDYQVENTDGRRATYWDVALGYGAAAGPIALGITGHYLRGTSLGRSHALAPRIDLIAEDIEVGYAGIRSDGGSGVAFDLGVAYQPIPSLTLGGTVANAYARIDWSDELLLKSLVLNRQDLEGSEPLNLVRRFNASERPVEPGDERLTAGITAARLQEEAYPPTAVSLGAAWQVASRTRLAGEVYGRATRGLLGASWARMVALGVEQSIPLITLRAGYGTDFDGGSLLSAGAALGPMDLGIARRTEASGLAASRSGWVAVFGLTTPTRNGPLR
jgi:hypothetical protein